MPARRIGVARALSKAGACSRTMAATWVRQGRVSINGISVGDPEHPVRDGMDRVEVDGRPLVRSAGVYLALNKPRGLVTSARDERGRDTVYRCLDGAGLDWIAPVGRLDRASEGLLLLSNDPQWAAGITDPVGGLEKTYHVQVDAIPDDALMDALGAGTSDQGEDLVARSVRLLRHGRSTAWLEVVLDEGRNRHIRRLFKAHGLEVKRLVRVAIGSVQLGSLAKGAWRHLAAAEVEAIGGRRPDQCNTNDRGA